MAKFKLAKIKAITLPLFKLQENKEYYFRIDAEIYTGKKLDEKKGAARLAHVTNLETGEKGQIIFNTVLEKELVENYGETGYVGKGFELIKHRPAENKNYATFSIAEVAIPDDLDSIKEKHDAEQELINAQKASQQQQAAEAVQTEGVAPASGKTKTK